MGSNIVQTVEYQTVSMNRGSSTKIKQKMKKSLKEKNRVPKYKQRVGNSKAALYWDYQI